MELNDTHTRQLLHAMESGLPLVPRPYAAIGEKIGLSEREVITAISTLLANGIIKRMGVVVRHRELGYRANAMVVWNIDDDDVASLGTRLAAYPFVTLCYRRPRVLPRWPFNLFTMIHGRDRRHVLTLIEKLVTECDIENVQRDVLFSKRRFKQRGARYGAVNTGIAHESAA